MSVRLNRFKISIDITTFDTGLKFSITYNIEDDYWPRILISELSMSSLYSVLYGFVAISPKIEYQFWHYHDQHIWVLVTSLLKFNNIKLQMLDNSSQNLNFFVSSLASLPFMQYIDILGYHTYNWLAIDLTKSISAWKWR